MKESRAWSLGWEDPLEYEMATHSSILAWKIPWAEKSGGLQSTGLQRVRHGWATDSAHVCMCVRAHTHTHTHTHSIYTTPIDRYFFKHKVEFFMALISATVKNSMVTPTHCSGDFREIEAGQIRRMVTDHFSLPWSLFLQVHPGSHRQVLGLSGNCSVVGRVFVFMMLLWIIFCQICIALALPGSTPVTGGFWPLRVARQDLMQTIHALPGPDGSTQQALLFHSQKSEISWIFPFSPNKWKSEQLYLDKPGPCWSNSFLQIDEHECKWEFPK